MQRQVFQSLSEADNSFLATTIARSGLSVWPWIVSDAHSQFDAQYGPGGANSCSLACLRFAQLVLHKAHTDLSHASADVGRFLTSVLGRDFFGEVLAICGQNPGGQAYPIEVAFRSGVSNDWAQGLSPLLYGTPKVYSPAHIAELAAALEETNLNAALTLTSGFHHRVCVYIPHRVPLFLVFDSAQRFGRGASTVVHTSRAAATTHLIAICDPGAGSSPELSGDFFVSRATMDSDAHRHRVHTAVIVLALRLGAQRAFSETEASLAASATPSAGSAPGALGTPSTVRGDRSAEIAVQDHEETDFELACRLHCATNPPDAAPASVVNAMLRPRAEPERRAPAPRGRDNTIAKSPRDREVQIERDTVFAWDEQQREFNTAVGRHPPAPRASTSPYIPRQHIYPTPPHSTPRSLRRPSNHDAELRARTELATHAQREQLYILNHERSRGRLDRYAEAGLEKPWVNSTRYYAGTV
ncbi:hypothetical protein FB451DRAFT_1263752 [Mycena latifolia]|nr:hypothetical protein FB451DRAFT_1263752 [Mycena latifolia]